jgi:hypothetical protein
MLKNSIKYFLAKINSKLKHPVVVASCGRSCSTLLTMAIAESALRINKSIGQYPLRNGIVKYEWRLEKAEFVNGMVYKTHDLPPSRKDIIKNVKFVYTYSDPYKIVPSLVRKERNMGKEWIKEHSWRLKGEANSMKGAFRKDIVGFRNNFDSWRKRQDIDILFVRANSIWVEKEKIEKHIGINLDLPEKRERKSDIEEISSQEKIEKMKETYSDMHELVRSNAFLDKRG